MAIPTSQTSLFVFVYDKGPIIASRILNSVPLVSIAALTQTCQKVHGITQPLIKERIYNELPLRAAIPLDRFVSEDVQSLHQFLRVHLRERVSNYSTLFAKPSEGSYSLLNRPEQTFVYTTILSKNWGKNTKFENKCTGGLLPTLPKGFQLKKWPSLEKRDLGWKEKEDHSSYSEKVVKGCLEDYAQTVQDIQNFNSPVVYSKAFPERIDGRYAWLCYDPLLLTQALEEGLDFSEDQLQHALKYAVLTKNRAMVALIIHLCESSRKTIEFDITNILKNEKELKELILVIFEIKNPKLINLILPQITGTTTLPFKECLERGDNPSDPWLSSVNDWLEWFDQHIIITIGSEEESIKYYDSTFETALKNKNTKYLDLLIKKEFPLQDIVLKLCLSGNEFCLPFLKSNGEKITECFENEDEDHAMGFETTFPDFGYEDDDISFFDGYEGTFSNKELLYLAAIRGGSVAILEIIDDLWQKRPGREIHDKGGDNLKLELSLESGNNKMWKWITTQNPSLADAAGSFENNKERPLYIFLHSIAGGNITMVKNICETYKINNEENKKELLREHLSKHLKMFYHKCVRRGRLEVLQFLRTELKISPFSGSMSHAFQSGNLEMIRFILEDFKERKPSKMPKNLHEIAMKNLPPHIVHSDEELAPFNTYLRSLSKKRKREDTVDKNSESLT